MTITHLQLVSIPVRDQDVAMGFYRDTLGFDLVADEDMDAGRRWVQLRPKYAATSVTLVTWFATMPPGSMKGIV